MSNTPLAVKVKNLFATIDLENILEKISVVLAVIGEMAVGIVMAVGMFLNWLFVTVATAAVWCLVWLVGFAFALYFFVSQSGFKFTKLMEWLS
jgi:hypothetical protein